MLIPAQTRNRDLLCFLVLLYSLPLLVVSATAVVSLKTGIPPYRFTRDPAALMGCHPFIGFLSNLGILGWCATGALCLFSWSLLRHKPGRSRFSSFLLCSGLLTILLMLDDFFMFHERIFSQLFRVGENDIFAGYVLLTICLLVTFRKSIVETEYWVLITALGFFGLSFVIDLFQDQLEAFVGPWRILLEDGFKFLGIIGWLGYFLRCCFALMK